MTPEQARDWLYDRLTQRGAGTGPPVVAVHGAGTDRLIVTFAGGTRAVLAITVEEGQE